MRPPVTTEELLLHLRRAGLLDEDQVNRLAAAWPATDEPRPHAQELVRAGLLTRYQAERVLAGRARSLRLGPYRILDRLGRGGMGQVYKAEHLLLRRLVALKVLACFRRRKRATQPAREPGAKCTPRVHSHRPTQLRREIETTASLAHPNIVAAHDACRIGNRFVLVLEYVDGIDLERLLADTGPLPVSFALELLRQAALALGHLHEQGLVHRDVKPANLILTHTPGKEHGPVVKLLDLGLACPKALAGDELCGTPDYLAPERGQSSDTTDIRSDLYSLGCTFYELLCGRVPFPGGPWTGKLLRHRLESPEPIQALRPGLEPEVAALLDKLMARDPDDRFATPAAVVAAVEALTRPAPLPVPQATAPVTPSRPTHLAMPRRAVFACLCLVAVCLGAGAGNVARRSLAATIPTEPVPHVEPEPPAPAQPFGDLLNQIEEAPDGGVVLVPPGRHRLPPIQIRDRRLTLRAAGGKVLLVRTAPMNWVPFLHSNRDLTLEGIDLQGVPAEGAPAPLIEVESGRLSLRRCNLHQSCAAPALSLRQGSALTLEHSSITALGQAIAVQVPEAAPCQVHLQECQVRVRESGGLALLLWSSDFHPLPSTQVVLERCRVRAGRVVACRSLNTQVGLSAQQSHLVFLQGFVCLDGLPTGETGKGRLCWRGERNTIEAGGPWIRLDGRAVSNANEENLAALGDARP
ncbi:MAG: serine/threonine-protein kinase [Gemmataceae bacterium]